MSNLNREKTSAKPQLSYWDKTNIFKETQHTIGHLRETKVDSRRWCRDAAAVTNSGKTIFKLDARDESGLDKTRKERRRTKLD